MKKFLLSIGLVSAFAANAQYTITSASNPVAGDMESTIATNTAGLTLPASGSGQVWNYSTVTTGTNSANTTTYVAISSVPNANLFAGSTLGGTSNGTNYDVYQLSGTVRNYLGTAVATASDCEVWSNPATIITLPFTFGSTSNDNFALTNSQYTLTGNIANSGDGKGTLTLPSGTFNNVLKVSSVITETATGTGFVITVKVIQHQFFSAASKFPLFFSNYSN
ncbi:MAG: hypothetical protein HYX39_14575 [Bacteroidetes bacterium]|nr:hypothetical protein [Bacteroidota bacterium]